MNLFRLHGRYVQRAKDFPEGPHTTKQALDLSIAKWAFIVKQLEAGQEIVADGGTTTCALCLNFNAKAWSSQGEDCEGCPVAEATGKPFCDDTPYTRLEEEEDSIIPLHIAKEELTFLQGLRQPE